MPSAAGVVLADAEGQVIAHDVPPEHAEHLATHARNISAGASTLVHRAGSLYLVVLMPTQ